MKTTNLKQYIFALAAATTLGACDSFLDKQPSASEDAPITEASQLMSLYDNLTNTEEHAYVDTYSTDDFSIPIGMYDARPSQFNSNELCFYTLASSVMETTTSNSSWQYEYAKIFTANTMINDAASVNGTEAEKNEVKCNGHFMRAWSYFRLATLYCLPYSEANRNKLGLPLRLGTLFTENISRATLGKTFDQILADLSEAERLCVQEKVKANYAWRTSQCAIYGLYARVYLYMNNYTKAMEYVNKALALAPELFNYNNLTWATPVSYPESGNMPAQTLEYCETHNWSASQIYKYSEWIYIRRHYLRTQWYSPSQALLDCYEDKENDLRFKFMYVEHGNRRFTVPYEWYRYDIFNDGGYAISGLTTSELLLMKAELQARSSDWNKALNTLNTLREARFATGKSTPLTASSQTETLQKVLKERRRELPFTVRLWDIKRFAISQTPDDDVTINREFYNVTSSVIDKSQKIQVTAKGDDPRLAIPIPLQDIQNAQGAIKQNPFQ